MPTLFEREMTDPGVGPGNVAQVDAMRNVLNVALLAGAVGAGGRTLQGLGHFLGRNLGPAPKSPVPQSTLTLPVPVAPPKARRVKQAEPGLDPAPEFGKEPVRWLAGQAAHGLGLLRAPGSSGPAAGPMAGNGASSMGDMPWAIPAVAAAAGGGLYGGYKLTDWLLDKTRNNEVDSELEAARKRYREAMMGMYGQKAAGADPVGELYEKSAGWVAPAVGLGLTGMGALGLASGMATYGWARGHSKTKALEEALRRRREMMFAQSPQPIMAVPVPAEGEEKAAGQFGELAKTMYPLPLGLIAGGVGGGLVGGPPGMIAGQALGAAASIPWSLHNLRARANAQRQRLRGKRTRDRGDAADLAVLDDTYDDAGNERRQAKSAAAAQAAGQVLQRFGAQRQEAQNRWQVLLNGPPKGGDRKPAPAEPQAPQLPTLAGLGRPA